MALISYKDIEYELENKERLKRYYNKRETRIRLKNYSDYYNKLEDYHLPCFEIHSHKKIMFKRQKLKYRLKQRD